MSAIATTQDGDYIYLALENASGQPVVVRCPRSNLSSFSAMYNPAAGTAGNVIASGDPDVMIFYGNFGSGVQVVKHVVSTGAETNISPSGLTTKVVNALAVNPSNVNELWATVNTDQDLLHTTDQGTAWETLNAALGVDPTALLVLPGDDPGGEPPVIYVAGNSSGEKLYYSPNDGSSFADVAGAGLAAVANIVGVEYAAET